MLRQTWHSLGLVKNSKLNNRLGQASPYFKEFSFRSQSTWHPYSAPRVSRRRHHLWSQRGPSAGCWVKMLGREVGEGRPRECLGTLGGATCLAGTLGLSALLGFPGLEASL